MNSKETSSIMENMEILCCPRCGRQLVYNDIEFTCHGCQAIFKTNDGIPMLYWQNEWGASKEDVTQKIRSFYEKNPFPDYDDFDNVGTLIEKARQGVFARLLDAQIPTKTRVLECGCGTGQLTNFLLIANRTVIGTDITLNSLRLAQQFKTRNNLKRSHFYQMNLFRPCFNRETFDLVISNGVLHHTSDPFLGFKSIAKLVRPKGYIIIGLYHKYGRIVTDIRRIINNATKDKFKFFDRRAVDKSISTAKSTAWFLDQYKNPHESKHTVEEVLGWLREARFTFINSIPSTVPFHGLHELDRLFTPHKLGNRLERFMVNIDMILRGIHEGGFFIVIARNA
jgi:SAM-dependent methyltransferase